MFLDSYDCLVMDCCEKALEIPLLHNVAILHFDSFVETEEWVLVDSVMWAEMVVKPLKGFLRGKDIVLG